MNDSIEKITPNEINIPGTTSIIDEKHPIILFWNPQPDITAFEVGVSMGLVMASASKKMFMEDFTPKREGMPDVRRHFLIRQKNAIVVPKGSSANLPN